MKRWHLLIVIGLLLAVVVVQAVESGSDDAVEDDTLEDEAEEAAEEETDEAVTDERMEELHTYLAVAGMAQRELTQGLAAADEQSVTEALIETKAWLQALSLQTRDIDMHEIAGHGGRAWYTITDRAIEYIDFLLANEAGELRSEAAQEIAHLRERLVIFAEHIEPMIENNQPFDEEDMYEQLEEAFAKLEELPRVGNSDRVYQEENRHPDESDGGFNLAEAEDVSEEEMRARAASFMSSLGKDAAPEDLELAHESTVHALDTVGFTLADQDEGMVVDVSVQGGEVLDVHGGEAGGAGSMSREDAEAFSEEVLQAWDETEELTLTEVEGQNGHYTFSYVPQKDDVPVHPRQVRVEVDGDNGRLLRLQALNYYQHDEITTEPALTEAEAREAVSDHIVLQDDALLEVVQIDHEIQLVYVFNVEAPERMGAVKINAEDGEFLGLRID
ncbi:germination protein YpeB [Salsuginibacillus halophilus]|uniref:Germination protein YpeB n=1 Tax=Salsuginibacillus halophilus TaxID=517424 RepID=A0A2P8HAG5_9BACI|nr:PepSY1/2 domain-containing protein [Salsuginibacillus halophilus]PSL43215.1 germination protein YpeB [Salsuginibacillus halophilus]